MLADQEASKFILELRKKDVFLIPPLKNNDATL